MVTMIRRYNYRPGTGGYTDLCDTHASGLDGLLWETHSKAAACDMCAQKPDADPVVELTVEQLRVLVELSQRGEWPRWATWDRLDDLVAAGLATRIDGPAWLGLVADDPRNRLSPAVVYVLADAGRERLELACRGTR